MGIFSAQKSRLFTTYRARIQFRDKLMGGTPKDPKIITSWLRTKTGVSDQEELKHMMRRTLIELGVDLPAGVDPDTLTYEQLVEASETLANRQAVGFKRDAAGLYVEGRTVKAMLKEGVNIVFEGMPAKTLGWTDKAGTRKFALAYFNERVFVNPDHIALGVAEPSGLELFIGHTTGPTGPQSNLTYYEYVQRAVIEFDVLVLRDCVKADHWPEVWPFCEENGLGALRSQGFGRFDVLAWDVATEGGATEVPAVFRAAVAASGGPVAV